MGLQLNSQLAPPHRVRALDVAVREINGGDGALERRRHVLESAVAEVHHAVAVQVEYESKI
jgi:hypothetical protein